MEVLLAPVGRGPGEVLVVHPEQGADLGSRPVSSRSSRDHRVDGRLPVVHAASGQRPGAGSRSTRRVPRQQHLVLAHDQGVRRDPLPVRGQVVGERVRAPSAPWRAAARARPRAAPTGRRPWSRPPRRRGAPARQRAPRRRTRAAPSAGPSARCGARGRPPGAPSRSRSGRRRRSPARSPRGPRGRRHPRGARRTRCRHRAASTTRPGDPWGDQREQCVLRRARSRRTPPPAAAGADSTGA